MNILESIFSSGPFALFDSVIPDLKDQKKTGIEFSEIGQGNDIWDPAGRAPSIEYLKSRNRMIDEEYKFYKENPTRIRRNILLLGGITAFFYGIILLNFESVAAFFLREGFFMEILLLPLIPPLFYFFKIKALQRDLVKKLVAEKNGWHYSPQEDYLHLNRLQSAFPRVFKALHGRNVQDEFWGTLTSSQSENVPFYSCIVEYQEQGKKKKNKKLQTVFAIRLNKNVTSSLEIVPKNFFSRFRFSHVSLEHQEFNKIFSVVYSGNGGSERLVEIFKKLSPAVQEILVDLAKKFPSLRIVIDKDSFFFVRDGRLFDENSAAFGNTNMMQTNFFWKVELHPYDEIYLNKKMNELLSIAKELPRFLD